MELPVGTKIWCPVSFAHEPGVTFHEVLERPDFRRENGAVNLYAVRAPYYCSRKWNVSENPDRKKSIRCICKTKVPKNWTCFKVVGLRKNFRIVEPVVGNESEVTASYRYNRLPHSRIPII